ncbi:MAG: MBL fold metallo-hydrolase [Verrucomicrobiales bacterium]|nr:MBL fold metallo-hydrolase [Verrucomicrobiales bacterium]
MCDQSPNAVTEVIVRMYKLGTGDCFALKFLDEEDSVFTMLIDCGFWSAGRTYAQARKYISDLKAFLGNEVDLLIVTHEHEDHVRGFQAGKKLFTENFTAKRVWMGWTEEDGDPVVEEWKKDYGQKKRALAAAAMHLRKVVGTSAFEKQYKGSRHESQILGMRKGFSDELLRFSELHIGDDPEEFLSFSLDEYVNSLKGMAVVKNEIPKLESIRCRKPGELIDGDTELGLPGIRIYVLGPPMDYAAVKQEHGEEGESYEHNEDLSDFEFYSGAVMKAADDPQADGLATSAAPPFDTAFEDKPRSKIRSGYRKKENAWRTIDHDWLFSGGALALRMNSLTNNLSLALAIEFKESGKVLLFPGDAEFGSWKSWQRLSWTIDDKTVTANDLLNRAVFYKVAHHLSHNGTAKSVGLDQMTNPDLVAMATLDYDVISSGWTSTMPNKALLQQLLEQTKGRTMIMNEEGLYIDPKEKTKPWSERIREFRNKMSLEEKADFEDRLDDADDGLFIEYRVKGF